MANTRKDKEGLPVGDPDGDFDGMPWAPRPEPVEDIAPTPLASPKRRRPVTTKEQWRNYSHQTAPELQLPDPASEEEIAEVAVFLSGVRAARQKVEDSKIPRGALVSPQGRTVLGSRAMTAEQKEQYLRDNPGSYIAE